MIRWIVFAALVGAGAAKAEVILSPAEVAQTLSFGPWPPVMEQDPSNRVSGDVDAVALGASLFSDPVLSVDGGFACSSCHDPEQGFTTSLDRAVGREVLDRNSPSLMNLSGLRWFGWMMPCAVQTFDIDQADDARRWLRESLGTIHQSDLGGGVLHLALMGKLDPAAYAEEEQDLDAFLSRTETPRVLLDVRQFEGWQSLSALPKHLTLVYRHYAAWEKIAILGNRSWQKMSERVLGQVRGGETRFFSADQESAAKSWLTD